MTNNNQTPKFEEIKCELPGTKDKRVDPQFYQQVPNGIINDIKDGKLIPTDIAVYMVYLNHLGEKDYCWPKQDTVGGYVGISRKAVSQSVKRLEDAGYVKRVKKTRNSVGVVQVIIRVVGARVVGAAARTEPTAPAPKENSSPELSDDGYAPTNRIQNQIEYGRRVWGRDMNRPNFESADVEESGKSEDVPF